MKDSNKHGARLKTLCNRLKRQGEVSAPTPAGDPTTEIVLACLSAHTTENKARTVLNRLRSNLVDFNELRVCRIDEIIGLMGRNMPEAREAAQQIITVLGSVFDKNDSMDLNFLLEGGKREARAFLESLAGADAYLVARVMLLSLDAHAFPVHQQLLTMLQKEEVVPEKVDLADLQGFLERHVSASSIQKTYALLRHHADTFKPGRASSSKSSKSTKAQKTKKSTAKKTSKKKS